MGAKRNLDKLRVARYGFYYKAVSARNCARTDPLASRIPEM